MNKKRGRRETSTCEDCQKAHFLDELKPCKCCGGGLFCEDCKLCNDCGKESPGTKLVCKTADGTHEIHDGVLYEECYDCDEKWETCLDHLAKCACGKYLCMDQDEHKCRKCDTRVCRSCGLVPVIMLINDGDEPSVFCEKHFQEGTNEFIESLSRILPQVNTKLQRRVLETISQLIK